MPESPGIAASNVATFAIKVNGTPIPTHYGVLLIEVASRLNVIPSAVLHIDDGSVAQETFPISESDAFVPGNTVEIALGYNTDESPVFQGLIVSQGLRIRSDDRSVLVVRCLGHAAKMTRQRCNRYFEKQKDSDIISKVISENGLTASVEATSFPHPEVVQYYSSDWDFIMSRAELNGLVVHAEAQKINVQKPKVAQSAALKLTYGSDILRSDLDLDATDQMHAVACAAWDPVEQKVVSNKSSKPTVNKQGNLSGEDLAKALDIKEYQLHTTTPTDKSVLKTWADARLLRARLARIRGSLTFYGSDLAKPNSIIEIDGLGERFNGQGYISGVIHRMEEGAWTTEVTLGLSADWFVETKANIEAPSAAGLLPGIDGLYTAVVKQIHEDPASDLRVLVDLPMIDSGGKGVWARLGQLYASNGFGTFFFPEVGDEVIVGFLQNDPRFPIILASVYSKSKHPALYNPDDKNTYKGLTTRSEMKIEFNDEDKIFTILTPGGKEFILDEKADTITLKDNHKNEMLMDSSGITFSTEGDFSVKAKGNIKLEATQNVESKATGDFKAEGMQVSVKGKSKFAAEGPMAEVKAAGQLTLKGGMVMIN